jgi:8-oxo-dGTP diphosphatase
MKNRIPHRIAAGGLVIMDARILLVRYRDTGATYLVAPGGAIYDGESLREAAEREIYEETGIRAKAQKPVMIENIRATRFQMVKIWYLCSYLEGMATETDESRKEGIISVNWYTDEQLVSETVYPEIIKSMKIQGLQDFKSGIIDQGVRFARF